MSTYTLFERRLHLCIQIESMFERLRPGSSVFSKAFTVKYLSNYFGIICLIERQYNMTEEDDLTLKLNEECERFISFMRKFSVVVLSVQMKMANATNDLLEIKDSALTVPNRFGSGLSAYDGFSKDVTDITRPRKIYRGVLDFDLDDLPSQDLRSLLVRLQEH